MLTDMAFLRLTFFSEDLAGKKKPLLQPGCFKVKVSEKEISRS